MPVVHGQSALGSEAYHMEKPTLDALAAIASYALTVACYGVLAAIATVGVALVIRARSKKAALGCLLMLAGAVLVWFGFMALVLEGLGDLATLIGAVLLAIGVGVILLGGCLLAMSLRHREAPTEPTTEPLAVETE
jgi:drug/metabolite transporter (DMT)-like permease